MGKSIGCPFIKWFFFYLYSTDSSVNIIIELNVNINEELFQDIQGTLLVRVNDKKFKKKKN